MPDTQTATPAKSPAKQAAKGGKAPPFEKSSKDKDSGGLKEGSKKEEALDKKQAAAKAKKK